MRPVIALFARAPVPGRVKTRLIPALGAEGAAELHRQLVSESLDRLAGLGKVELHTDEATEAWPEFAGERRTQCGGDLGERMLAVLSRHDHAMIVGSDAPGIPEPYLLELLESPADVALGPAEDGGYYAIATRRTHPEMFAQVAWSSGQELRQTIRACEGRGLSVHLGRRWFDIDTPEDLERARAAGILSTG